VNATDDNKPAAKGQATTKAQDTTEAPGNTAMPAPAHGDHDRVAMLSLKADGTLDQLNPEMIGDPDATLAQTKRQFTEQAVSAADVAANASVPMMVVGHEDGDKLVPASEAPQDPSIQAAQDEHERIAKAAEQAAEATVNALTPDGTKTTKA
jgi:hypothetical protein